MPAKNRRKRSEGKGAAVRRPRARKQTGPDPVEVPPTDLEQLPSEAGKGRGARAGRPGAVADPDAGHADSPDEEQARTSMVAAPVDAERADPVDAGRADPVDAERADPVDAEHADPVDAEHAHTAAAADKRIDEIGGSPEERAGGRSGHSGAQGRSAEPTKLGKLISWYLTRFRRAEPISFGEAFRSVERILVMPERGVSGALFSMPTLKALRRGFPNGKIAVLVHEGDKDLLEGVQEVDRVIGYDLPGGVKRFSALLSLGHRVGSYGFDIAIVLDREFDAERAFLSYLSKARVRGGIQSDTSQPFYNLEVSRAVPGRARAQLGLEIARVMGIDVSGLALAWDVPERERKLAEQLIHFRKPREDELLVGFDPGPGRGGTSLSVGQQAKLLDKLCNDYHARAILLTAPEHHWIAAKLETMLSRDPIVVQQRRMRDVVSLLGQCDLFVAGNTDLVYFAVAMGIPTVSLMTPGELRRSAFPETNHLEIVELTPGERFPIQEFIERTQAVLLSASG